MLSIFKTASQLTPTAREDRWIAILTFHNGNCVVDYYTAMEMTGPFIKEQNTESLTHEIFMGAVFTLIKHTYSDFRSVRFLQILVIYLNFHYFAFIDPAILLYKDW